MLKHVSVRIDTDQPWEPSAPSVLGSSSPRFEASRTPALTATVGPSAKTVHGIVAPDCGPATLPGFSMSTRKSKGFGQLGQIEVVASPFEGKNVWPRCVTLLST